MCWTQCRSYRSKSVLNAVAGSSISILVRPLYASRQARSARASYSPVSVLQPSPNCVCKRKKFLTAKRERLSYGATTCSLCLKVISTAENQRIVPRPPSLDAAQMLKSTPPVGVRVSSQAEIGSYITLVRHVSRVREST